MVLEPGKEWGMVAYADGGARPNPGPSGTGVHGYFYDQNEEGEGKKPWRFTANEVTRLAVPTEVGYKYTDAAGNFSSSKDKNFKVVKPVHIFEIAFSSSGQYTNNYAELNGLFKILMTARAHEVKKVAIILDSEYVLKGITERYQRWSTNGWVTGQGEPISNVDLWQAIVKVYKELLADGYRFAFGWIKGHQGHPGNSQADHCATVGVMKSQKGLDDEGARYYTVKEYFEPKRDRHPLLALKRIYFDRVGENYVPGKYFMANPGKDDSLIGKPQPETVYAVVQLKEEHPIIGTVIQRQHQFGQDFNEVMMIKTDTLFTPDVYRMIQDHGEYCMLKSLRGTNLLLVDERPITIEKKPIGITMRAIDCLNSLDQTLADYQNHKAGETTGLPEAFQVHPLNDEFYESQVINPGKKNEFLKTTLKKEFGVGHKDHKLKINLADRDGEVTAHELTLKLGYDLPDRNTLKQLDTESVTVELITWRESVLSVRYATVISCSAGIAIWSNFYADRLILKK